MIVYRLTKQQYAADLSGMGARLSGGRWNSQGVAIVYTSDSRALCTTEIAVHTSLGLLPLDYQLTTLSFPDEIVISEIDLKKLPKTWRSFPYSPNTRIFGDQFVKENRFLILKVPSAVVQGDFNYLINSVHPDILQIKIDKIEPFGFDDWLFAKR